MEVICYNVSARSVFSRVSDVSLLRLVSTVVYQQGGCVACSVINGSGSSPFDETASSKSLVGTMEVVPRQSMNGYSTSASTTAGNAGLKKKKVDIYEGLSSGWGSSDASGY